MRSWLAIVGRYSVIVRAYASPGRDPRWTAVDEQIAGSLRMK
jgi:hypothetical protein